MIERVLILSRNEAFAEEVHTALKKFRVEVIDIITSGKEIPFDELRHRYHIIVLDKSFLGNARHGVKLVREMRGAGFEDPIIAVELVRFDGELFSLSVAGCNFALSEFDHDKESPRMSQRIRSLVERISGALVEERH